MKVDLSSTKNLRVVLIDKTPAILLTYANQNYKFHNTAEMDLTAARLVFYRMRHIGSIDLDYFDPIHIDVSETFYMTSTTAKVSKNHIWNAGQADTFCHLWSTGNIKNFEIHEEQVDAQMCTMCKRSFDKAKSKKLSA